VEGRPGFSLQVVSEGFVDPVLVVGDPLETDVLYVLQKTGQIKRVEPGEDAAQAEDWLDIGVISSGEAGLLGLAFHPDYDTDPRVYVAHQPDSASNALIVMEYTVTDGVIDEDSARPVIGTGKPLTNHNGGMIQFGLDGLLYFAVGDGGHQNDQCGHAQDTETFLGKILRIDPDADGEPDTSPPCTGCFCVVPDLPFDYTIVANPAGPQLPEIYAVGFRNPWRFSIDPSDGRLWVADVGQDQWEEVAVVEAGSNHGWGGMEGFHCFNGACDIAGPGEVNADGYTMPITEFEQSGGPCAVIGLGNYRSCEVPAWDGLYFYGDYCTGEVMAVRWDGSEVEELGEIMNAPGQLILGGGYNAYGDVFVTTEPFPGSGGTVYRIAPE
jgi:glucose/arabinose dehydrogenase